MVYIILIYQEILPVQNACRIFTLSQNNGKGTTQATVRCPACPCIADVAQCTPTFPT